MLKVNLTKQAVKVLKSLPQKQSKQLATKVQELRVNPLPHDHKKLKGYPYLRVDVGEYRIIYAYDQDILEVYIIDKRNDGEVYKKMKRLTTSSTF
jgi:mRNA interferase RelE/StbE